MTVKESTLKITVDVDKAESKARSLANELNKLGDTGKKAGQQIDNGMTQSALAMQKLESSSASAQIRFQTMTQGMLNLSTAAAQTYTSTSNLDRVMVKSKASTIAHERALDALHRKQFQLNKEMEKSVPNMEKIGLLKNEIKTATENETVALEKMKIAQQDVTDVQILFASNIANVLVSSTQTFTRLIGEQRTAMIFNTLATKANTLANINSATVLGSTSLARSLDSAIIQAHMRATVAGTLATRLQTVALQGLKIALGPIGLIFIGISAAMMAYETNALGLKDTINGLLGIHDDLTDSVEKGKDATDDYAGSLGNLADQFGFVVPNSIASAIEQLERYKVKIGEATEKQILLNRAVGASPATNFDLGGIPPKNKVGGIEGFLHSLFNPFPEAQGESTPFVSGMTGIPDDFSLSSTQIVSNPYLYKRGKFMFGTSGATDFGLQSDTILRKIGLSKESFAALSKDQQFMSVFNQGLEPFLKRFIEDPVFRKRVKDNSKTEQGAKFFTPDEWRIQKMIEAAKKLDEREEREADVFYGMSKEMKRRTQITMAHREFLYTGASVIETLRKQGFSNTVINGIPVSGVAKFYSAMRGTSRDLQHMTTNEMYKILGISRNKPMTIEQTIALIGLKNLGKSVVVTKDMLPIEMGLIENVLNAGDFNRLQIMETELRSLTRRSNVAVSQHSFIEAETIRNDITRLLLTAGGRAKGLNTGRGIYSGISATAAFQTSGQFKIDPIFEQRRKENDRFANSGMVGILGIFARIMGENGGYNLSRSGSKDYMSKYHKEISAMTDVINTARQFGITGDQEAMDELAEARISMMDNKKNKYAGNNALGAIAGIMERFGNRTEGVLRTLGIDIELTTPVYTGELGAIKRYTGRKGGRHAVRERLIRGPDEQMRLDIGASEGVRFPFGSSLVDTVRRFQENGMFTNFNNVSITRTAMAGLNMTEQDVFDIRFNATRGDRELLNSLRYVEMLQAGSSGTSPL